MGAHKLLIVSPAFHDYDEAIAAAFRGTGFEVSTLLYDAAPSVGAKLRTKAIFELPERFGRDTTAVRGRVADARVLEALRARRPDLVLVIKGDVLGDGVWDELDRRRTPTVLWLYDELRRTRWDADRLERLDGIASYSEQDVLALHRRGIGAAHVPLGFDTRLKVAERRPSREVTFIGARYPQRAELLSSLDRAAIPVRAYGRSWSHDLRDRLRTWGDPRPGIPSGRDLRRAEAYSVMQASSATLNIHGDQDGFTMRTFEAAGVGALQLCDRADVAELYEPGEEILVFDGVESAIEQCRRATLSPGGMQRVREAGRRRTLAEHTLEHRARSLAALF